MVAAKAGVEKAGEESFAKRQSGMLAEGFSFSGYERDGLYVNLGQGKYENISGISGIDAISDGRAAVYADFDNDGDTDVFLSNIQDQAFALFRNNVGSKSAFLRVNLVGGASGRDAYGAVVRVGSSAGTLTKIKSGGSGFLAQHDPRLLFGLGTDTVAQWVEVTWPSGTVQRFEQVPINTAVTLTEGSEELVVMAEKRFSLPNPLTEAEKLSRSLKIKVGDRFPKLDMRDMDGEIVSFDGVTSKTKVLVNLWATWCVPCRKEMPELELLHAQGKFAVVGINLDNPEQLTKVKPHLKRMGISYENLTRGRGVIESIYAGEELFVPISFLLDENGVVLEIFSGWSAEIKTRLTTWQ